VDSEYGACFKPPLLPPRILRCLLGFWNICAPLLCTMVPLSLARFNFTPAFFFSIVYARVYTVLVYVFNFVWLLLVFQSLFYTWETPGRLVCHGTPVKNYWSRLCEVKHLCPNPDPSVIVVTCRQNVLSDVSVLLVGFCLSALTHVLPVACSGGPLVHLQGSDVLDKGNVSLGRNCFVIIVIQWDYGLTCTCTSLVGERCNNDWHY
jgi:hypothetical protein